MNFAASTSAVDCLARLILEMTCYVSNEKLELCLVNHSFAVIVMLHVAGRICKSGRAIYKVY